MKNLEKELRKLAIITYHSQRQRNARGQSLGIRYCREDFVDWFCEHSEAKRLMRDYIAHGRDVAYRPHVGKKNYNKPYGFDNIELTRLLDFSEIRKDRIRKAINNRPKRKLSKPVVATVVKTGEKLRFPSCQEAAVYFDSPKGRSNVSRAARGEIRHAYGCSWEFEKPKRRTPVSKIFDSEFIATR